MNPWPNDIDQARADRAAAGTSLLLDLALAALIVAGLAAAVLAFAEPCTQGPAALCAATVFPLHRWRRDRKGQPAGEPAASLPRASTDTLAPDAESDDAGLAVQATEPGELDAAGDLVGRLAQKAYEQGRVRGLQLGYRRGYVHGARAGRLAAFCWGLLLGAGSVAVALSLGWLHGGGQ